MLRIFKEPVHREDQLFLRLADQSEDGANVITLSVVDETGKWVKDLLAISSLGVVVMEAAKCNIPVPFDERGRIKVIKE